MKTIIDKYWNKYINLGIHGDVDLLEVSRTRLLNKLAIITFFSATGLLFVRLLTTNNNLIPSFFSIGMMIVVLFLNHKQHFKASRITTCFLYPVSIALITVTEGAALGEFIIFLILVVLAFVLLDYDKKLRNICIGWIHIIAISSYLYIIFNFEVNPIASNRIGTILLFAVCVIVMSYLIVFYQDELLHQRKIQDVLLAKLQKKNSELERFAFISSHDLKVPLQNIIGFSELITSSLEESNTASASEYALIINKNANRMDNIIQDTLEIISYDHAHHLKTNIDLEKIITQTTELIAGTIKEKNVTIQCKKRLPTVLGAKSEIFSCFKNLIENAIKYNESEAPFIEFDYEEEDSTFTISIRDNGIGINKNQYNNIFEMYQRLVRQDQFEGTGLGLPICKKIIENNGGKIWVESIVGEGSTFFIELPKVCEGLPVSQVATASSSI